MVRRRRTLPVLYFSDGFMGKTYDEGFNVIFNYGSGQRSQGLCWGALICILESILKPYVPPCAVVPLGSSKTGMESSVAKNTPSQIKGALCVPFHLP